MKFHDQKTKSPRVVAMKNEATLIKNSGDPGEALESKLIGLFKLRTTKKWLCKLTPESECFLFFF